MKTLHKLFEKVIKLFNNYSKIVSKYNTKYIIYIFFLSNPSIYYTWKM